MKLKKFRKQKEKVNMMREKRSKKQLTDEEFDRSLQRRRTIQRIVMAIVLTFGIAFSANWPWAWGPLPFFNYVGLAIMVLFVFSTIEDFLKKEGMFYRLEDEDQ